MENIINIVNFIRGAEPRHRWLDLVEPVRQQIRLMKEWDLPGTFLIQYDAMLREDMVSLLRELPAEQFEIGAIPCVVLIKGGMEADRSVGLKPREAIEEML